MRWTIFSFFIFVCSWTSSSVRVEDASAASVEKKARERSATASPFFKGKTLEKSLKALPDYEIQGCGKELLTTMRFQDAKAFENFLKSWDDIFMDYNGLSVIKHFPGTHQGWDVTPFTLMRGHALVRLNGVKLLGPVTAKQVSLSPKKGEFDPANHVLEFDVGTDLRNCWGQLRDLSGNPVCSGELITPFAEAVSGKEKMEFDKMGQSGSTIIASFPNFVIKNAKDVEEYRLIRESFPLFEPDVNNPLTRQGIPLRRGSPVGCYSTAIVPMCAIFQLPNFDPEVTLRTKYVSNGSTRFEPTSGRFEPGDSIYWIIMRKVEIPGADPLKRKTYSPKGQHPEEDLKFDLKGPSFSGYADGKSKLLNEDGKLRLWGGASLGERKDLGFSKMFPNGITLSSGGRSTDGHQVSRGVNGTAPILDCGFRDAAFAIQRDASMLKQRAMTDYSLFGVWYQRPKTNTKMSTCHCVGNQYPTWPLIFYDGDAMSAFGIIDYIERATSYAPMSTMKPPGPYEAKWMRMWPIYFRLPQLSLNQRGDDEGILTGSIQNDIFRLKGTVIALEKIKWKGGDKNKYKIHLQGTEAVYYFNPMTPGSTGSKYKVNPGSRGTIVGFTWSLATSVNAVKSLIVQWSEDGLSRKGSGFSPLQKVFRVEPQQVLTWPRQVLPRNEGM